MKVVVTMQVDTDTRSRLERELGRRVEIHFAGGRPDDEVDALCDGASVIVGSDRLHAILAAHSSVRLVQVPWAGVDHVCKVVREFEGVRLANSHANAHVTAQFSIGLALALVNRLAEGHQIVKEGRWDERWLPPSPANMSQATAGILGTGSIGTEIARLIRPFVSRVIGLRRTVVPEVKGHFDRVGGKEDLDWLLSESDLMFVTLPLTKSTHDLIRRRELDLLGPGGYLIAVGRGPTVNETAFFEALSERRIAGAAVEVWYDYEPAADSDGRAYPYRLPFHTLDNVLMSPHRAGWTTPEPDFWIDMIENVNRLAAGKRDLLNEVDVQHGY